MLSYNLVFGQQNGMIKTQYRKISGPVAQLGARLNGIQEVEGSIPFGSTK